MENQQEALRTLGKARTRLATILTAATISLYFGFIGLVAFAKPLLGSILVPGLSVGIALGSSVILVSWLLTWAYVRWTNVHYDVELERLRRGRA